MAKKTERKEKNRINRMSLFEKTLREKGYKIIAGVDEAGRGPLAGPVVAAACILPIGFFLEDLNDSKMLSETAREKVYHNLREAPDVIYGIGIVDHEMIDKINILQATLYAMQQAIDNLSITPDLVLFDGNQIPEISIPSNGLVKGDLLSVSIAAASVIAKWTRDHLMCEYHKLYPEYGFNDHKGYGTKQHLLALEQFGPTPIHRRSFDPVKQLKG